MHDWSTLGFGIGLDYGGGLGFSYTAFPQKNIGFFAAGGVIWGNYGYNLGIKLRLISDKKIHKINPYLKVMYGTNTSFVIEKSRHLNKNFYGLSYGGGIDFGFKKPVERKAYWSFSVLIPVIDEEAIKNNSYLKEKLKPKKVYDIRSFRLTIGYNMIIGKR